MILRRATKIEIFFEHKVKHGLTAYLLYSICVKNYIYCIIYICCSSSSKMSRMIFYDLKMALGLSPIRRPVRPPFLRCGSPSNISMVVFLPWSFLKNRVLEWLCQSRHRSIRFLNPSCVLAKSPLHQKTSLRSISFKRMGKSY